MIMNQSRCCEIGVSNSRLEMPVAQSRGERPQTLRSSMARRYLNTVGWLVPNAILTLMPMPHVSGSICGGLDRGRTFTPGRSQFAFVAPGPLRGRAALPGGKIFVPPRYCENGML